MAAFLFQFVWQIDDGEGVEGAFFDADAASYAKGFHNQWHTVFKADGFYLVSHRGTKAIARSTTTLGFASILIENSNSNHVFPTHLSI